MLATLCLERRYTPYTKFSWTLCTALGCERVETESAPLWLEVLANVNFTLKYLHLVNPSCTESWCFTIQNQPGGQSPKRPLRKQAGRESIVVFIFCILFPQIKKAIQPSNGIRKVGWGRTPGQICLWVSAAFREKRLVANGTRGKSYRLSATSTAIGC